MVFLLLEYESIEFELVKRDVMPFKTSLGSSSYGCRRESFILLYFRGLNLRNGGVFGGVVSDIVSLCHVYIHIVSDKIRDNSVSQLNIA